MYWRHFRLYLEEFDSIDQAIGFICDGEDYGNMASEGVFSEGEPVIHGGYVDRDPPTEDQAEKMRAAYRHAKAGTSPWS